MNSQLFAAGCMLLSMASYQVSASFAKQLFEHLSPLSVTLFRLCFAALIVIVVFRSWRILPKFKTLKWRDLLCYSISLGLMNLLFYSSLSHLPLGLAVGLEFIGPLGLALCSIQNRRDLIWVFCSILGIMLIIPWGGHGSDFSYLGMCLAIGAGLFWAAYIYFGHKVVRQDIGIHMLSIAISFSAIMLLPIELWQHPDELFDVQYWWLGLVIAILATAIPYALDLVALKHLARLRYSILTSLSPVVAALTGYVLLSEQLSFFQWIALLLIVTASIGIAVTGRQHGEA